MTAKRVTLPAKSARNVTPGKPAVASSAPRAALATRTLVPVEFVEAAPSATTEMDVDLTQEGFIEAPSALTPTAEWTAPGQYLEGSFLGQQDGIGPNASRLYNVRMADGTTVSVWGTTVLDNRMDLLRPPVGALMRIIYIGDSEAKKGQNPARLFKVGYKPLT